ncbi:MAG: protease modulator HflC [Planctomycetaceae bacterium]
MSLAATPTDPLAVTTPRLGLGGTFWRWPLRLGLLAWLATALFMVEETELAVVERLGIITAVYDAPPDAPSDRGLHLKWPWPIATVRRFDRRQLLLDPPAREMFTKDRKNVTVSGFLVWKIADPDSASTPIDQRPVVKFYRRLGDRLTAEARLDARLRAALSAEIGRVDLNDLLHVESPESGPAESRPLTAVARQTLQGLANPQDEDSFVAGLGVQLVDLRLRRLNLPEGNRIAVYERMRTERMRIAERYRSAGAAERVRIESQANRHSSELMARAEADAERIRGEGEAAALATLNAAHALDPQLYEFQRTLAAYAQILNRQSTLVLSAGSRLFRLLHEGPRPAAGPHPGADPGVGPGAEPGVGSGVPPGAEPAPASGHETRSEATRAAPGDPGAPPASRPAPALPDEGPGSTAPGGTP